MNRHVIPLTTMFVLVLGIILTAPGCSQEQQAEYTKQTIAHNLPKGAVIIEYVPSNGRSRNLYTIYKFRGQCFLRNSGKHHMDSLANIKCPERISMTFKVDPLKALDMVKAWEDR